MKERERERKNRSEKERIGGMIIIDSATDFYSEIVNIVFIIEI